MTLLSRVLTSFRTSDKGDAEMPGLVQDESEIVWLIAPDGTRSRVGSGGSSSYAALWAKVDVSDHTLTAADSIYYQTEDDISIRDQNASNFSIGIDGQERGQIVTAVAGFFQAAIFYGPPGGVTLDGGSAAQRWQTLEFSIGSNVNLPTFGGDISTPVLEGSPLNMSDLATTYVGQPGYVAAGDAVLHDIGLVFVGATGSDEITSPFANSAYFIVWQIA